MTVLRDRLRQQIQDNTTSRTNVTLGFLGFRGDQVPPEVRSSVDDTVGLTPLPRPAPTSSALRIRVSRRGGTSIGSTFLKALNADDGTPAT